MAIFFLVGFGLVQVYSSSFIFAIEKTGDGLFFFKKQLFFATLGLSAIVLISFLPRKLFLSLGFVTYAVSVFLLLLTLVPGVGVQAGGASRWIQLPLGFRFEPTELFKVSLPFVLAILFVSPSKSSSHYSWWLKRLIILLPLVIFLKQPDFGSFAIAGSVVLLSWIVYGLSFKWLAAFAGFSVPALYLLVWSVPYRQARVLSFLDPWGDPTHKGFQVIQSMLSFHSGQFSGAGLGKGLGKLFFLPEAHTDFTLAVLGEEWGFIGLVFVISVYGFVGLKGFKIAQRTRDEFHRCIAFGLSVLFLLHSFINMGVNMGLLPTKGLTLPFLSYGGSSLFCTCLAMGWLLKIDAYEQEARIRERFIRIR